MKNPADSFMPLKQLYSFYLTIVFLKLFDGENARKVDLPFGVDFLIASFGMSFYGAD